MDAHTPNVGEKSADGGESGRKVSDWTPDGSSRTLKWVKEKGQWLASISPFMYLLVGYIASALRLLLCLTASGATEEVLEQARVHFIERRRSSKLYGLAWVVWDAVRCALFVMTSTDLMKSSRHVQARSVDSPKRSQKSSSMVKSIPIIQPIVVALGSWSTGRPDVVHGL